MLARVQVEHELPQRAMQPRDVMAQHHETAARHACAGLEIHATAEALAQLHMILRREIERARRAPASHFLVGILVCALRHGILQQVGQSHLQRVELGLHAIDGGFGIDQLLRQLLAAREQRRGILTLALGHAHLLGGGIAFGAQPVGFDLRGLAAFLEARVSLRRRT